MIPQSGKKQSKHKPRTFNALAWFGTNAPKKRISPSRSMIKSQTRRMRRMVITLYTPSTNYSVYISSTIKREWMSRVTLLLLLRASRERHRNRQCTRLACLIEFQVGNTVIILGIARDEREVVVKSGRSNKQVVGIFGLDKDFPLRCRS
jgi:hypothetical protein